eukprot:1364055-Pyramimonas_sp.AAC.1
MAPRGLRRTAARRMPHYPRSPVCLTTVVSDRACATSRRVAVPGGRRSSSGGARPRGACAM